MLVLVKTRNQLRIKLEKLGGIFRFTAVEFDSLYDQAGHLFEEPVWFRPDTRVGKTVRVGNRNASKRISQIPSSEAFRLTESICFRKSIPAYALAAGETASCALLHLFPIH